MFVALLSCLQPVLVLIVTLGAVAPVAADTTDYTSYLAPQVNSPNYTVASIWSQHRHLANFATVRAAAQDTFDYLDQRVKFDDQFKNPCWHEGSTLKCLPYFQILGVSKCGTTDLYHRLTLHDDMVDCGWKGPHFWDESAYPRRSVAQPGKYDGSFGAYVSIFDRAAVKMGQAPGRRITGEASSNTYTGVVSFLRGHLLAKGITGAHLAHYLWEASPWSRFIVLFRDPVDRYYSAYYYYRTKRMGPGTPQDFHDRAAADIKTWSDCVAEEGELKCLQHYQPQQLLKGMYAAFMPHWLDVWPRSRFLFLRNEDYDEAPAEHVKAAMDFLGMTPVNGSNMGKFVTMKRRNTKRYESMLNTTRTMLQDFYRPFNRRLSQLMGNDPRWLWGY